MANALHNIICLEAEWEYRYDKRNNKFSLNTEPLLNWLRTFHGCDIVYRHILNKQDLQYYLDYFASHKREFKKYDIIYIACHGWHHAISLEGEDGHIDLCELKTMANGFFENRIIHFGSCKTLANPDEAKRFKEDCGARLVSGYEISVDAMTSAIADAAFFNEIMTYQNITRWRNEFKLINMSKKLHISLIFSNLVVFKTLSPNHRMYNLYTKFVKILEICKQFSENLVNESGNVPRRGPVPKFSDLEVVALSLTAETESIDSEKWLFDYKLQEYKDNIPNLISRRQFNDRRKKTAGLCEELRKRIAMEMDGGEEQFFVDSKPIEVCRVARGKRCKMGRTGNFSQAPDFGFCASQNTYYFGYKLHALCGLSGVIHSYDLSKASVADLHYMKDVKHTYHDCSIYGDKGYIGADVQLDLFETAHIRLECPYRLNQKDWKPTFIPFAKVRKRIETIFSQLTDQFLVIRNYAKITNGLFARIIGKISALTILQYVNFINDKPIGRIKYALN